MTEHQLRKANRLKAEREDIQGLINILADSRNNRFGVEVKKRYFFLKYVWIFKDVTSREFSHATKEVLVKALIEHRDKITKEIEDI